MQRLAGNRAVARVASGIIQRRGENPYAPTGDQPKAHAGWELTAHHVVAHSTLVGALAKLSEPQRKEIYALAIPTTLTDSMLKNLKVDIPPQEDPVQFKTELRAKLVGDLGDDVTVVGIKLGDMRASFYEWQAGNQFLGPNTSIRPEPSASKDDIDFDGRYFTALAGGTFDQLTGYGAELKQLNDADAVLAKLKQIVAITKDSAPRPFDASAWTEVGTLGELTALSQNQTLRRGHMPAYSFFKIPQSAMGDGRTYAELTPAEGGEWRYKGLKVPIQLKHPWAYLELENTKLLRPAAEKPALEPELGKLGITITKTDKTVELSGLALSLLTVAGKKFTVPTFSDQVPAQSVSADKIIVPRGLFDGKKLNKLVPEPSLYEYCKDKGMPTASYLPKVLYESLQPRVLQPEVLPLGPPVSSPQDAGLVPVLSSKD